MMRYWIHTIFLLCCCMSLQPCSVKAQNLDSLWTIWQDTTMPDTARLLALHRVAWTNYRKNPDSAFVLANMQLAFARLKKLIKWEGIAYNTIATVYFVKGDYPMALKYYHQFLNIYKKLDSQEGIANAFMNIGSVLEHQGNNIKALQAYFKCLKIWEDIGDNKRIGNICNNIGLIYQSSDDCPTAMKYFNKASLMYEGLEVSIAHGNLAGNIAICYREMGELQMALEKFMESLKIFDSLDDEKGMAGQYNNIGNIYKAMGEYNLAIEHFNKSLAIRVELGNKSGIANVLSNIGAFYNEINNYSQALVMCKKGLAIAEDIGSVKDEKYNCKCLSEAYGSLGNSQMELRYYKQYIVAKDSLFNNKTKNDIAELEAKVKYEKIAAADSVKNAQLQEVKDAQLLVQQTQLELEGNYRLALIGGLALITLFLTILYGRFQVNRRQKRLIEAASIKTKDSIKYAERIQEAILPSMGYIESCLENLFIIYKPKDIVSGDFYWVYKQKNENILIALADCTGHGVPGAFMSMIGTALLNEIIIENGETKVNKVLDTIRNHIISSFAQKDVKTHIYDGLDITLIDFNPETRTIKFAGAGQVFYILRNGEFIEERGDNYPVGYYFGRGKPFNLKEFTLMPNDQLYLFTDGMIDQFGGEDKKKFGYNRLKAVILEGAHLPMDEQKKMLEEAILSWKGKGEQIDDISVMGVKIS
ncbi:MAG TPA: tetratricopeptide repeat protein [Flavobacteriales bacterium]|nr:tetratricopeptide repeat protein [Flavobacteriales bacterium]HIN40540.1 tetratricopeptide repeat protein [Flavobacteriales bacterium]